MLGGKTIILSIDDQFRLCPKCNTLQPLSDFNDNQRYINGQSKWCLQCKRAYRKAYKEKNAEKMKQSYELRKEQYKNARKEVYHSNEKKSREKLKKWYRNNTRNRLFHSAKRRAKAKGLDFNIEKEDIVIPYKCPVLNIKLAVGKEYAHDNSPSLDRIIPEKGYVKGNVIVVSHKANSIKNNATVKDLEKVFNFYKNITGGDSNVHFGH